MAASNYVLFSDDRQGDVDLQPCAKLKCQKGKNMDFRNFQYQFEMKVYPSQIMQIFMLKSTNKNV